MEKIYQSPELEVIEALVEQGYSVTNTVDGWGDGEKVEGSI